ncbi:ABC transporter permease [Marispirochaeta aestuarii]|uniref:ABC transporter permease n=1 Tax=Marispirochaeta aestuarii TaxID=1963862 RepID=UPI0029C88CBC|nr:ABC transporter permease [Marispirochaeta aestuarii]
MTKNRRILVISGGILLLLGLVLYVSPKPLEALADLCTDPLRTPFAFGNLMATAGILTLSGAGIAVAMSSGSFNLGGEGQAYLGSLLPVLLLLALPGAPPSLMIPLGLAAGAFGGSAMGWLSGIMREKIGTDELISSYLAAGAVIPIIDYLIAVPLRDPDSYLLSTPKIAEGFRLVRLLPPSQLTSGIFLALGAALLWWFLSRYTLMGYELRLSGANPRFASLSGIRVSRYRSGGMSISGALCGLAGALMSLGVYGAAVQGGTGGIGWNGIAVALIARYRPALILPAALFFAYLTQGLSAAVMASGISNEMGLLLQAAVFIAITAGEAGKGE